MYRARTVNSLCPSFFAGKMAQREKNTPYGLTSLEGKTRSCGKRSPKALPNNTVPRLLLIPKVFNKVNSLIYLMSTKTDKYLRELVWLG